MPSVRRRRLLAAASALPLVAIRTRPANAAEFSYKLGTDLPASHPLSARNAEAAARIKVATGGRLEITVFPNSQLGGDTDMLTQVRSGALEFLTFPGMILSILVPVAAVPCVGFAFKDTAQAFSAMDGNLGKLIRSHIAKHDLFAYDHIFDNNFRQVTSSVKPIVRPADLVGMKIRVPPGGIWTSMFQTLGAAPASINFSGVYSALQTKVVDGEENPLSIISSAKLYEVQKYCSMTSHAWDGFWLLANPRALNRLPPDIKEIAAREFARAAQEERADNAKLNADLRTQLTAAGLQFNDVDQEPFRDVLRERGFYTRWKEKFGDVPWNMLEATTGPLS